MLTLIGRAVQLFKKDFQLLSNYRRTHPHFFWYLGLDALVSVALIFVGFSLYTNMTNDRHELTHVGAEVMTAAELKEHAKENDVLAYWLGIKPGYEYAMNHSELGIADVFYVPVGSQGLGRRQFLYEVKTYVDQKTWESRTHTLLATSNTETIAVDKEITIKINRGSMKGVIVTFAHRPEIVGIAYPARQDLAEMKRNALNLVQIR